MRLLEASIRGFGRLVERRFRFAPGAVLVVGANESGKTTLQQFLLAMLFGLKREVRKRRDYLPEYDRYRPWNGAPYAGRLVYELANGERFEIQRVFDRRDESVQILDAVTGRDRTLEFPQDERKERTFMQRQIALSRQLFEATTAMGQLAGRPADDGVTALRERIQGLLDSGDEQRSAHAALVHLEQLAERRGSERTPTRGLGQLQGRRSALQAELEAARARHAEILDLHARRAAVSSAYAAAAAAWAAERRAERGRERTQLERRLRRWQALEDECSQIERQLQEHADVASVDVAAEAPAREIAARSAALAAEVEERSRQLQAGRVEARELQRLETNLAAALGGVDRAGVDALQDHSERLREHVGRVREARARHAEEQRRNRTIVESLRRHHGRDWSRDEFLGELAAQRERARGEAVRELGVAAAAASAVERRWRLVALGVLLAGFASVGALVLAAWADPWLSPMALRVAAPVLVGAVAVGLDVVTLRRLVLARDLARSRTLRTEQAAQEQREAVAWLERVLQRNGVQSLEALEEARREYETLRAQAERISAAGGRDLVQLEGELAALAEAVHTTVRRCDLGALQSLQAVPSLAARGILPFAEEDSTPPAASEDSPEVRRFMADLQRVPQVHRAYAWLERVREERAGLQLQDDRAAAALDLRVARLAEERATLAAILRRNDALDLEALTTRVRRARERQTLLGKLAALRREQLGILGDEASTELRARWAELQADAVDASADAVAAVAVPPAATLESLAQDKDRLAAERAQIEERLAARERDGRLPAEIELELQEVEAGVERERRFHAAVRLAKDTLEQVTTALHRDAAPRMNERVSQLFAHLSRGAHDEVRLDEDFTPRVRVDGGAVCDVESLSGGAADQLYFALRVTAGEILARRGEPLPLLLDDPFVQYDPARLQAALDLVAALAREHQVLFFTCEEFQVQALAERFRAQGIASETLRL